MEILHRNFLKDELLKWRYDGIIDEETSLKIASRYSIDLKSSNNHILILIAYFFFGLSLIILVGANWEEIPSFIRIFLLISLTLLLNIAGYFKHKNRDFGTATALFLLGSITFCASVALISQIYHINKHLPNGILFCAIGVAILGVSFKDSVITAFSLIVATMWVGSSFKYIEHIEPMFLVFIVLGVFIAIKAQGRLLSAIIFISIYIYLVFEYFIKIGYFNNTSLDFFFISISYLLFMASLKRLLGGLNLIQVGAIFYRISLSIATILMVIFQFMPIGEIFGFYDFTVSVYTQPLFIFFVVTSALLALFFKDYMFLVSVAVVALLPIIIENGVNLALICSVLSVVFGIVLIKRANLNAGITLIFITALARYIELIGDYYGASLLFLVFAIIMLVVARKRRAR